MNRQYNRLLFSQQVHNLLFNVFYQNFMWLLQCILLLHAVFFTIQLANICYSFPGTFSNLIKFEERNHWITLIIPINNILEKIDLNLGSESPHLHWRHTSLSFENQWQIPKHETLLATLNSKTEQIIQKMVQKIRCYRFPTTLQIRCTWALPWVHAPLCCGCCAHRPWQISHHIDHTQWFYRSHASNSCVWWVLCWFWSALGTCCIRTAILEHACLWCDSRSRRALHTICYKMGNFRRIEFCDGTAGYAHSNRWCRRISMDIDHNRTHCTLNGTLAFLLCGKCRDGHIRAFWFCANNMDGRHGCDAVLASIPCDAF